MRGSLFLAATVAAVALMAPVADAAAKEGDLLVRARGIWVTPDESSSLKLGTASIPGTAEVKAQVVPEVDFTYFLSNNVAAELILATTPHDVAAKNSPLGASVDLGDVWLLPPTVTLQYHFDPAGKFSPYVGAGVNYTIFYNVDAGRARSVDYENSFGFALQAGVDIALQGKWFLNLDVKKLWLNTTATVDAGLGTLIKADVDIDPWIVGVGFGYRF